MVEYQTQLKTVDRSTDYAQNVYKKVVVNYLEEEAIADGVGRPLDRPAEILEFNIEFALCVFA